MDVTGNTTLVNLFFQDNYDLLLKKSQDYSRTYNYTELQPDEIVSELYLFTISNAKRTSKLEELILLSAATMNKIYRYSSIAMYYISRILFNITKDHRTFDNTSKPKVKYISEICDEQLDEPYEDQQDYCLPEEIFEIAKRLSITDDNWWKYAIWYSKYHDKLTYAEMSKKYGLTITPLWTAIQSYNKQIRKVIEKENHE
jgi:hypothetical protein